MADLKNEYKSFLEDIEKNVKDKEDLKYVKRRFTYFLDLILDKMDEIVEYKKVEIAHLEQTQNELLEKVNQMQKVIGNIEKDIYSEEGFDFEIVCPYCDYEFIIDVDEDKKEVTCPECENIIELDWSGDVDETENGCSGSCHGCHGCAEEDEDDDM